MANIDGLHTHDADKGGGVFLASTPTWDSFHRFQLLLKPKITRGYRLGPAAIAKGGSYVQAYPTAYRRLRLSEAAIQKGIQFAKSINAEVTGFHVILPFHIFSVRTGILADTKEQYESESKGRAEQFLGVVKKAAEKAGVRCDTEYVTSSHPYEMIIKAAEKKGCDLIMMASHGRRGLQGLLIGSETHKVLTHTEIPVLVLR